MDASEHEAAQIDNSPKVALAERKREVDLMLRAGLVASEPVFHVPYPAAEADPIHVDQHRDARTSRAQGAFLAAFTQTGRIDLAAKSAEVSRGTHYLWKRSDPEYAALFLEAEELASQLLMDEAVRRAQDGVQEPVFHNGQIVGHVLKYSDRLMERLLEARFPERFRSNLAHRLVDSKGDDRKLFTPQDLDALIRAADARDKEGA